MSDEFRWLIFTRPPELALQLLVTAEEHDDYRSLDILHCKHDHTELRERIVKGGRRARYLQCLKCGRPDGSAQKTDLNFNVPQWDDALVSHLDQEIKNRREEIYQTALERTSNLQVEGYADYAEYLASEEWAVKRRKVFQRDGNRCQACLENDATEVHHLTYDRIFKEPMFDLVSICRQCHETLHRKKIAGLAALRAKSEDGGKM